MDKNGNISINYDTWKSGIAGSPLVGMGDMSNVDMFDDPGLLKIAFAPTDITGGVLSDRPTGCAIIGSGSFIGDAVIGNRDGVIYEYNGTLTETVDDTDNIQQMIWWKGYIINIDYDATLSRLKLSAYNPSTNTLTQGFVSTTNGSIVGVSGDYGISKGALAVGIDDVLYVGSGKYVASLTEKAGQTFDPTDSNTYTWAPQALDLPEGYQVDGMINLNDFLMISAGVPSINTQAIFPWDRVSASYNFPTPLNNGITGQLAVKDNLLYMLNGIGGAFSVTNRTSVENITEFKNLEFAGIESGISQTSNPIGIVNDVFWIGISSNENEANKLTPLGVYTVKDGAYTRLTLSCDQEGDNGRLYTFFTVPYQNNQVLVGWEYDPFDGSASTYGVDLFGKSGYRYTGYKAYFESPLYTVGRSVTTRSYTNLEVSLAKELSADQGIKVKYRKNLTDDWTTIATFDFDTYGAKAQFNTTAKITDVSTVQLRVEMTTGASSTTTPELIEVRLL